MGRPEMPLPAKANRTACGTSIGATIAAGRPPHIASLLVAVIDHAHVPGVRNPTKDFEPRTEMTSPIGGPVAAAGGWSFRPKSNWLTRRYIAPE